MNTEFIISFAVLFGATIALICAVYIYLMSKKKQEVKEESEYY